MITKIKSRIFHRRVCLIALLAGICLISACGKKTVATAANEFEASLMFDVLYSNGFKVEKSPSGGESKGWDIIVDEGWFGENEAATAIQVLRDYGLPRPPEEEIKTADSLGMVSDSEEKQRQKRELQQQIERLLYNLPDVISARVVIALPQDDILTLQKTPPTATVSLVIKETEPKFTDETVRNQVSRGVPNLKPENVFVSTTKQSLREIPLDKLKNQRRSNAIFAIGTGLIILLALALGAVWLIAKKRKRKAAEEENLLEQSDEDFEDFEPALLNAEDKD